MAKVFEPGEGGSEKKVLNTKFLLYTILLQPFKYENWPGYKI